MEQVIGAILLLAGVSYMVGRKANFSGLSERLDRWQRRPLKKRISHHEYIEEVKQSANEKYWEEKRRAEDKERVKKNFPLDGRQ